MTERTLGTSRRRRLRLFGPLALLAVASVMLIAAAAAPAINTNPGDYNITEDQDGGRNDEPGQKDLTLQGTDSSDLPTAINVLWNWDETSVGGGNSLDGCTLFDSDGDGNANFAFCATVGNVSNQNKTLVLKSETLYTCGDTRNDRCSSQIATVTQSGGTACELALNSSTNPFGDNPDTRIFCTVVLADVGATTAVLLNTCSYPSEQPNSDPSDCVLIPGKANPGATTAPTLVPQDSAVVSGVATGGSASGTADGKIVFSLYAPADTTCTGTALFSQAIAVTADGTYTTTNSGTPTAGYTISADGIYRWKVVYNGDTKNNGFEKACGVEQVNVDITP
jgi:hypothetical protein